MRLKKRIAVALVLIAAFFAARYLYRHENHAPANQLLVSGNIEAHEALVSFKVPGRIVDLPVEEGQWVKSGALLARLENDDLRQKLKIDQASLQVREANLSLALAGTRTQEIEAAQQSVLEAAADLQQRKLDYERAQKLFRNDAISAQDRDLADTNLQRSQAAYDRAKQRYNEAVEGSRREEIAIARANVEQARKSLDLSRVNLRYTELRAPNSGVISVRQAELGEVVSPGTPVITLADLDHVWLRAYISETELGHIRWGQAAKVRTDTYPGKIYRGRISFISPEAEFTPKSVQTFKERVMLVYRIKIDVENPNHELKPGMPADAEIDLKE